MLYNEVNKIVEASSGCVFGYFNKITHTTEVGNPAVFLNGHTEYRIVLFCFVLFFRLRLSGREIYRNYKLRIDQALINT